MSSIPPSQDRNERESLFAVLLEAPVLARKLYPRGGFAELEGNTLQVLIAVQLQPDVTVGELVEMLALRQGTVSTALARLQERGLIVSRADDRDARRQRQRVTEAGSELSRRFAEQAKAHLTDHADPS